MKSCLEKVMEIKKQVHNGAKKSFTLVELSIVLLILSLLVGSLLTGRQLVERAELQRIISDIDYYQKNVVQFQDTFGFLPGNMDVAGCSKNTILYKTFYETAKQSRDSTKRALATTYGNVDTYCASKSHTVEGYTGANYFASTYSYTSIYQAAAQLAQSGLITSDTIVQSDIPTSLQGKGPMTLSPTHSADIDATYLQPLAFNEDGLVMFASVDVKAGEGSGCTIKDGVAQAGCGKSRNLEFVRGSAAYGQQTELHNITFADTIDKKRSLILFYNDTSTTYSAVSANSSGLLSPSQTNKLDQKMDDGHPGTGKVLALKSGLGRTSDATVSKSVCYDQLAKDVSKAYYLSSDDAIYGCNIITVF